MIDLEVQKLKDLLREATKRIESLERKVEVCMKEIAILKEGGNI